MAKCDYCGSTIIFGGKRDGDFRFCNDKCHEKGYVLTVADQVPEEMVQKHTQDVHSGPCPKCNGAGPVDVHNSYKIWSMLIMTSWGTKPQISCRKCGLKSQVGNTLFSAVFGWWGIPWGLIMTPVQLVRNLGAIVGGPKPGTPSPELTQMLRVNLAAHVLEEAQKSQAESPAQA